ncbi:epoxyqueuosine reductase [Clostridium aminobutyricum]|uniref:Epoxyqueuosine reductase n=1 Tax=Clostridium aminobutyricum TaxID=33953 RepID=A0A939IJH4_CLOAM|nr:4Fe-4S double cluster binding domain-containing protein [Clostridium aminobutyricum]MBN7773608.1 epoxyqueuosine reductase [Clostridium aminobutyricum]
MSIEKLIQDKAYEFGYEKCGIVRIQDLEGYDKCFMERIDKVPASKLFYRNQRRLTNLAEQYPWAKSVIVVVSHYGHYKVPEQLKGHIGKHYIFDGRVNEESQEFKSSVAMEKFLEELGLRTVSNRKFGVVGLRWAAMKAGLGIVRRNNFFYTESGSWVELEAWITDKEMELIESTALPNCPKGCSNCIKACPTCSLSSPYTMNPVSCVSFLTTFGGRDLEKDPLRKSFGTWIYGCDACQDACPMNHGTWKEKNEFPEVLEIAHLLTPENIMKMDENFYKRSIQPKFFYLTPDELWKWKVNTLNFMRNNYQESYRPYILEACKNENDKIREIAQRVCKEIEAHNFGLIWQL